MSKKKRMDPRRWASKYLKSDPIPIRIRGGIGEGKPCICDICGERTEKIRVEFDKDDKLVSRCENCRSLGIWKRLNKEE